MQASGFDVNHDAGPSKQWQHGLLLSFCPTPEAHTEADQLADGDLPHGPAYEQLASGRTAAAATVLGHPGPKPRQGQGRAAMGKGEYKAADEPQQAEALPIVAAASAAHADGDDCARFGELPGQSAGNQPEAAAPAMITGRHLAGKQSETSATAMVIDSKITACDNTPPTEAVSVRQETGATASVSSAPVTCKSSLQQLSNGQSAPQGDAVDSRQSLMKAASGGQAQDGLPSMQAALHSPGQEACTKAQHQLGDDTANSNAAGRSQHDIASTQTVQDTNATVLAQAAVYPPGGKGPDPPQLTDTLMADDTPTADGTPMADDSPMADDALTAGNTPVVDDTPMADDIPVADDRPMADNTLTADCTPLAEETQVADGSPMADDTQMVGPAASSSKTVPASTQVHQEEVVALPFQAALQKEEARIEQEQQPADATATIEQAVDNSQPELPAGVVPLAVSESDLSAVASPDTAEHTLSCTADTLSDSGIVPNSEEPEIDVAEEVAGQLQHTSDNMLLDTAVQDGVGVHVPHSRHQPLSSSHQQHGPVGDQSSTDDVQGADAGGSLSQSVQGNLRPASCTVRNIWQRVWCASGTKHIPLLPSKHSS